MSKELEQQTVKVNETADKKVQNINEENDSKKLKLDKMQEPNESGKDKQAQKQPNDTKEQKSEPVIDDGITPHYHKAYHRMDKVTAVQEGLLDGGFAVVDREKVIEEETRTVTPWYKHFIHAIIAPTKFFKENLLIDPPRGISHGIVGSILFIILWKLFYYGNKVIKREILDGYRQSGIDETMLGQKYIMSMVTDMIATLIGVFIGALVLTILINIAKIIADDRAKFSTLYTVVMVSNVINIVTLAIEALAQKIIGIDTSIFGLVGYIDPQTLMYNKQMAVLANSLTLGALLQLIYIIIGYHVLTDTKIWKSAVVCISVQAVLILVSILFV